MQEVFRELIASRWNDTEYPLHGLYQPHGGGPGGFRTCPYPEGKEDVRQAIDFALFPYGEILARYREIHTGEDRFKKFIKMFKNDGSERNDRRWVGRWEGQQAVADYLRLLIRSIQRLGESQATMVDAHTSKNLTGNEDRDVIIDFDITLFYLKIIPDVLAMTIPVVFTDQPDVRSTPRFRNLIEPPKKGRSPLHGILKDVDWFHQIGGEGKSGSEGLRDARLHYAATHLLTGLTFNENWEPYSREISSSLIGRREYTNDMLNDMRKIIKGMFGSLDDLVREAGRRDERLSLGDGVYSGAGIIQIFGDTSFLKTMLPIVEASSNTNSP